MLFLKKFKFGPIILILIGLLIFLISLLLILQNQNNPDILTYFNPFKDLQTLKDLYLQNAKAIARLKIDIEFTQAVLDDSNRLELLKERNILLSHNQSEIDNHSYLLKRLEEKVDANERYTFTIFTGIIITIGGCAIILLKAFGK